MIAPFDEWRPPPLLLWSQTVLVPWANVMLLLLGFVLLGPTLQTRSGLSVTLPHAVTAQAVGAAGVVITVTEQSLIYVNGHLTTLDELPVALAPLFASNPTVLIESARQVPIGQMAQIWDLCRQLGATQISMATTAPAA